MNKVLSLRVFGRSVRNTAMLVAMPACTVAVAAATFPIIPIGTVAVFVAVGQAGLLAAAMGQAADLGGWVIERVNERRLLSPA